ncbi:enolase C-terminal domain-like protein [Loigolactobacillus jiayinensis]|uniref:Enolase C-terminal domain-like protein n=1 Tax=Loigolactobacillus jiayinensis TaxID=2486016 RepID=A0ABW1RCN4_9LACO|nr:enolase C-terminal domain-like protein [Loigolactobacillus jiayinensis]
MADESVYSPNDAVQLLANQGCDFINIKLMKAGGLSMAEKINTLADSFGVRCMIGCMIETPNSIAAAVAFAEANPNIVFADLDSVYMLASPETEFSNLKVIGSELNS